MWLKTGGGTEQNEEEVVEVRERPPREIVLDEGEVEQLEKGFLALSASLRSTRKELNAICAAVASEYKAYSLQVTLECVEDLANLRKAQEVGKIAVKVIKRLGTAEQKKVLATNLKKMAAGDAVGERRKELMLKFDRQKSAKEWEKRISKKAKVASSAEELAVKAILDSLNERLRAQPVERIVSVSLDHKGLDEDVSSSSEEEEEKDATTLKLEKILAAAREQEKLKDEEEREQREKKKEAQKAKETERQRREEEIRRVNAVRDDSDSSDDRNLITMEMFAETYDPNKDDSSEDINHMDVVIVTSPQMSKKHVCPVCGEDFPNKNVLVSHIQSQTCIVQKNREEEEERKRGALLNASKKKVASSAGLKRFATKALGQLASNFKTDINNMKGNDAPSAYQNPPSNVLISGPTNFRHEAHTNEDGETDLLGEEQETGGSSSSDEELDFAPKKKRRKGECEGWLMKLDSTRSAFKRRWGVFRAGCLAYSENPQALIVGRIELGRFRVIVKNRSSFTFDIESEDGSVRSFRCGDEEDFNMWVDALKDCEVGKDGKDKEDETQDVSERETTMEFLGRRSKVQAFEEFQKEMADKLRTPPPVNRSPVKAKLPQVRDSPLFGRQQLLEMERNTPSPKLRRLDSPPAIPSRNGKTSPGTGRKTPTGSPRIVRNAPPQNKTLRSPVPVRKNQNSPVVSKKPVGARKSAPKVPPPVPLKDHKGRNSKNRGASKKGVGRGRQGLKVPAKGLKVPAKGLKIPKGGLRLPKKSGGKKRMKKGPKKNKGARKQKGGKNGAGKRAKPKPPSSPAPVPKKGGRVIKRMVKRKMGKRRKLPGIRGKAPGPKKAPQKSRVRSQSIGSISHRGIARTRLRSVTSPSQPKPSNLEVILVSARVPNFGKIMSKGKKLPENAKLFAVVKVGKISKRQSDFLEPVSPMNFRKEILLFSHFSSMEMKVGVFLHLAAGQKQLVGTTTVFDASTMFGENSYELRDASGLELGSVTLTTRIKASSKDVRVRARQRIEDRETLSVDSQASVESFREADARIASLDFPKDEMALALKEVASKSFGKNAEPKMYSKGRTALHLLCMLGDADSVTAISKLMYRDTETEELVGVYDLNHKDEERLAPLHYCIIHGALECARVLLENKTRVDSLFYSLQPIHMAALLGRNEIIKLLAKRGADVDSRDGNMVTPLGYAAWAGKIGAAEVLVEQGAFKDAEDDNGNSPLLFAAMGGHEECLEELIDLGFNPKVQNFDGTGLLWLGLMDKNLKKIPDLLISKGTADLDERSGPFNHTLLQKAILFLPEKRAYSVAKYLLNAGAHVDSENDEGKTALFYACCLCYLDIVNLLVDVHGASVKHRDTKRNTPLHFTLFAGVAEKLLQKGALINAKNEKGYTPLHIASAFALLELKSCYMAYGADPTVKNVNAKTPIQLVSLVPPRNWRLRIPYFEEDASYEDGGGVYIDV